MSTNLLIAKTSGRFLLPVLITATASVAFAQNFSINWSTIDGGGGASAGGTYTLQGTVGQPDAGTMSGGAFTVNGGFWSVITAVQTPGAPLLKIDSVTGGVRISWPSPSVGFVSERTDSLTATDWTSIGGMPADDGTNRSVVVSPATGNWFFRLKQ